MLIKWHYETHVGTVKIILSYFLNKYLIFETPSPPEHLWLPLQESGKSEALSNVSYDFQICKVKTSWAQRGYQTGELLFVGKFYTHASVHRESNLITVQQDATVFSLLYFCRLLYMFRVLTPIIRSSYSCNYSFWYWITGSTTIRTGCWVRMVVEPVNPLASELFFSFQHALYIKCE